MPVFQKNVDAEGNETFVEVEISTLDVREHPEFKKVLEEQIKTRQRLAKLKKAAEETKTTDEENSSSEDGEKPQTTPPVIPTVDDVISELDKRRIAAETAKTAEETAWNTQVDLAMAKHKLPASMRALVFNSRNPEDQAAALSKSSLTFANSPAGGEEPTLDVDDLFAKIDKRLGFASEK